MKTTYLCSNKLCPLRDTCWRVWSPPSRYAHTWKELKHNENNTCDYYWPMNHEN